MFLLVSLKTTSMFKKYWLVTLQQVDSNEITPKVIRFIARDKNAWEAWDAIKIFAARKSKEDGIKWDILDMKRV